MFDYDIIEFICLFILVAAIFVIIVASIIIPIWYKNTKRKNLWIIYSGIVIISLFAISCYSPWFFKNKANNVSKPEEIIKYDTYAAKTALIPPIRGFMYFRLSDDYLNFKKDLTNGIKYLELGYKYNKEAYALYQLSLLYEIKGDYDKALETVNKADGRPSRKAKIYFLKGDSKTALKILNQAIESSEAGIWEYLYRGNIYDNMGKSDMAKKDYDKVLKMDSKTKEYPVIEEIMNNKNYFEDKIKEERKYFGIK